MTIVGRHVLFSGRVQGVGFRMTAVEVSREFAVTGFVRNLPDGRVEMVVEGEADTLTKFVAAVERAMRGRVTETLISDRAAEGKYVGFSIRY